MYHFTGACSSPTATPETAPMSDLDLHNSACEELFLHLKIFWWLTSFVVVFVVTLSEYKWPGYWVCQYFLYTDIHAIVWFSKFRKKSTFL